MKKELVKRWQTALVALPVLFLIVYSSTSFFFLVLIAALICLYEFYGIAIKDFSIKHEVCILGFIVTSIWVIFVYTGYLDYLWMLAVLNLMAMAFMIVVRFNDQSNILDMVTRQTFGIIYIPGLMGFMLLIHQFDNGYCWIYVTFIMIFACDTGGYFIGKQFGKHALCKSVSPKKTIEGFLGGLVLCVLSCLIFATILRLPLSTLQMIILPVIVGTISPLGDLFESAFKRAAHIKDSGHILPGHGGLLDRIDALLFSGPLIYGYKTIFVG
jgi:phosphatidate cytidylyltransferase